MAEQTLTLLVVDDEAAMREVLEMRLTEWGHRVLLAGDGAEARATAERERPDAVISDVQLPGLGGLELLQALKAGGSAATRRDSTALPAMSRHRSGHGRYR